MKRGIPFSPRNRCFVCGGGHSCKVQGDIWVLCMHGFGPQDAPPGYRFVKPLRNSMGGLFVRDDGSDNWNQEQRIQRRQEQEILRRQRSEALAQRNAQLLSVEERDSQYRLVNQNLTLVVRHRKSLGARGLSDAEINLAFELGALRTWNPDQRIFGLSLDLAGVNPVGPCLGGMYGIAIYAFDPQGKITGAQLKPENEKPAKYLWLSSSRQGGNGPQLPSGELPLFCWKHPGAETINEVWLCEGALKSLIVALKLWSEGRTDVAVIGTASAARYGEQTISSYLRQLNCKTLRLMPDAGAVINPHIGEANAQTVAWCQEWGCSVTVGWWGQVDKSHPDIDELKSFDALAFLTPAEFWDKHPDKFRPVARDSSTNNPKSSEPTLSEDEWQLKFGLPSWFKQQINRFSKALERFRESPELESFKKNKRKRKPKSDAKTLKFVPGKLPTLEEYRKIGCPVIRFGAGLRLQVVKELVRLYYQFILERSGTGTGKSHDAGLADPDQLGVEKIWYFSRDHRNPTTATVEANYTDMPVRNNGLLSDGSRRTALNNPHVRWPKKDESPNLPGNCFRTETFHTLSEKGYQFEVGAEANLNPICLACHMKDTCGNEEKAGPGHEFRHQRRLAFGNSRIRASLDSAPNPKALEPDLNDDDDESSEENVPPKGHGAILDEAMPQIKPFDLINTQLSDFDQVWAELESGLPEVHLQLKTVRVALRAILKGEIKTTRETYHGFGDAAIREALGEVPENLAQIIDQLELNRPNLAEILTEPDSFNKDGVSRKDRKSVSNSTSERIRDAVRQDSYREMLEKLKALACNWLLPFLKVWGFFERGSFRVKYGVLEVMTHNTRHAEFLGAMKWVLFQDATAKPEYLAMYLNVDPTRIVRIEQEPAQFSNLQIIQVTGLGLLGHNRSKSLKQRLEVLFLTLKVRHLDIAFIDHKEYARLLSGVGWWFNHNRGSNEYIARSTLASFGVPYQDIGSLQMIYITLTGDLGVSRESPEFCAFVEWQTEAEIAQCVGRLRANLRPDESVTYYSCADFDLEFLLEYYPGAAITKESAFSIAKLAGTATEKSHHHVQETILELVNQAGMALEKITQVVAATAAGVSQGRISQIAAKYGGWRAYKKLLAVLFNCTLTTANNSEPLDETQEFIANTYLPLTAESSPPDAIEGMLGTIEAYGWRGFQAILAATEIETRGRLLAALLSGLPQDLQSQFRALAMDTTG